MCMAEGAIAKNSSTLLPLPGLCHGVAFSGPFILTITIMLHFDEFFRCTGYLAGSHERC